MFIREVRTLNGTLIEEREWQDYFELNKNGTFTIKKLNTPVDQW